MDKKKQGRRRKELGKSSRSTDGPSSSSSWSGSRGRGVRGVGGKVGGGGGGEWPVTLTLTPDNFFMESLVIPYSCEFMIYIMSKMTHPQQVLVENGYCMTILIHDVEIDEKHVATITKYTMSFALNHDEQQPFLPRKKKLDSALALAYPADPIYCLFPVTGLQMSRGLAYGHMVGFRCPAASVHPLLEFKVLPSSSSILNLMTNLSISEEDDEKAGSN